MFELNLEREFDASAASLFEAWTNHEIMKLWFAPGNMTVPEVSSNPIEGGQYRIVMQEENGEQYIVSGKYLVINPNQEIAFTWQWDGSPHTTKVNVQLTPLEGNRTRIRLHHSEFTEEEFRDKHNEGWIGCLDNLKKVC